MAGIERSNPCRGCHSKKTGEAAPCCWNNDMDLSTTEYQRHFAGKPNVTFIRYAYDEWMGERVVASYVGPCPNLDSESGECTIQEDKPLACRDMEPLIHPLCCKTPNGRQ